jgi:sporulation protein YlmC with PRC-barrel domain
MSDTIATDETTVLIASNKVEGTSVYDRDGEKLGSIYNLMIDKIDGQVEYAVLQFGGVFGLGSDYYPLPWEKLRYDEEEGGYVVDIDKATLDAAPKYAAGAEPAFDHAYGEQVYDYYGLSYPHA